MSKKIVCLIMSLVIIISLCSFSDDSSGNNLRYSYTNNCSSWLYISGLNGECISYLLGYSGITTKIVVKQYLQVRDGNRWRTSQSWSKTYYSYHASFVNDRTLYSGNTYRVYTEFTVYSGSSHETVTAYSTTHTV